MGLPGAQLETGKGREKGNRVLKEEEEKEENRGREGEVLKGEVEKGGMAAVTLMQPAAQEANDQYR